MELAEFGAQRREALVPFRVCHADAASSVECGACTRCLRLGQLLARCQHQRANDRPLIVTSLLIQAATETGEQSVCANMPLRFFQLRNRRADALIERWSAAVRPIDRAVQLLDLVSDRGIRCRLAAGRLSGEMTGITCSIGCAPSRNVYSAARIYEAVRRPRDESAALLAR